MKKIPIPLLTLILSALFGMLFSAKTQALYKDENGATWWSVEELLEFSKVADAEEEKLCGNDYGCREELFFSRFENEDERYMALNMLKEGRFWITSINPTTETLELLYFDEDEMLKRWGIEEKESLVFVFLAWFDNVNGQIGNYDHYLPIESQFSDDLHLLYAGDAETFDIKGFPANTPFELPINNTGLINNSLGRIYQAVFGQHYNSKGYTDYSSCLANYEEGKSCILMFSASRGYGYFPPRENVIENEQNIDDDEEDVDLETVSYTEPSTNKPNEEPSPRIEQSVEDNKIEQAPIIIPKTPNTGNSTKTCEKTIEFPWWLSIVLLLGNITALWLFLPQKSSKNRKKVLTK